jgi:chemotaxis protein CheC
MMTPTRTLDDLQVLLQRLANSGLENAASGLSAMIGRKIVMSLPSVSLVSLSSVPERLGGPEAQVVGIYLGCEGEMTGHIMLILGCPEALDLVDLLLDQSPGTTVEFDDLAKSALAEVGNVTASFFLNAAVADIGLESRPTPPAVIIDMAGAIFDIMVACAGESGDELMLMEALFSGEERRLALHFWMLPDLVPLYEYFESHLHRQRG